MKEKFLISVIIPVYNAEKYLVRCVNSVLTQTYENIELVLVNDGSKDNSLKICKKLQSEDTRIKVIDKENEGAGAARNAGLDVIDGEYVMFIDADDWIEADMFSFLISCMYTEEDIDVAVCNHYIEGYNCENRIEAKCMDLTEDKLITNDISFCVAKLDESGRFNYLWNRLYKNSIIKKHNIRFEKKFVTGQDLDFNLKYFKYVRKCTLSDKPLYHYIKDGVGSLCARYKDNLYDIVTELCRCRYELYREFGMLENDLYRSVYEMTYIDYMRSCIPNMYRKNAPLTYGDRLKQLKQIFKDPNLKGYIERYQNNNRIARIFAKLVKLGSPVLAEMVYSVLFFVRNNFNKVYQKLK